MKALILCGGLGTRLRSVVSDVPKPMAMVDGKPFLEYILSWLKNHNVQDVILLAGYKADKIREYFGNEFNGMSLSYSIEPKPSGTAGAIKYASKKYDLDKDFILINGDTYFNVELESMIDFHQSHSTLATIALRLSDDISRYGIVSINDRFEITEFLEKEKSRDPGLINGGVYILNKKILDMIPEGQPYSIEREIFPVLAQNRLILGYPDGGHFIDIGIPKDYERAQILLPKWEKCKKKPAVFLDRDGVIIEDSGYVHLKEEVKFLDGAFEAIKKINKSGRKCIIVSNQAGIAHGYYSENEILETERWIENELSKKGAKIDGFYYCPYHSNAKVEKYNKNSIYRKPNPGMVLKAAEEHGISLYKSVMIGDKESDKIKLPQLKSYVIKSKYVEKWDFEFLEDAVKKLIGGVKD
jgi:D,D-heptose 1,7-bisphosphate phosphatase